MAKINEKTLDRFLAFLMVLLLVVSLVLGYLILVKDGVLPDLLKFRPSGVMMSLPSVSTGADTQSKSVLTFPPKDASAEAREAHLQVIQKVAVESQYLDLAGCKPQPEVLKVKMGSSVKLRNQDNVVRNISFKSQGQAYTIGKSSIREITFDFTKGNGYYGYFCDGSSSPVGIFLVVS